MSTSVGTVSIKVANASADLHLGKVQEALSYIITFHMGKVLPVTPSLWRSRSLEADIKLDLFELQFQYVQQTASTVMFVLFFGYP